MQLENGVAVITGAGSGIGRALAIAAARRGMRLALVGRRESMLDETASLASADACEVLPADMTCEAGRRHVAERVGQRFGCVHLLVNNAGVVHTGPVGQCDDVALEQLVATNVMAPMALVRVLLPLLRTAGGARVLNVGSMFGDIAFPYFAAYSATKFALRGYSDALRRELAAEGIGVTYAAPRATRTPAAASFAHLVGPMQMRLDRPEDAARSMLDAVGRDARSVYPGRAERLFVLLQRLVPSLVDRSLSRMAARADVRAAMALEVDPGAGPA